MMSAGEKAHLIKLSLCKHEDKRLDTQTHIKAKKSW